MSPLDTAAIKHLNMHVWTTPYLEVDPTDLNGTDMQIYALRIKL